MLAQVLQLFPNFRGSVIYIHEAFAELLRGQAPDAATAASNWTKGFQFELQLNPIKEGVNTMQIQRIFESTQSGYASLHPFIRNTIDSQFQQGPISPITSGSAGERKSPADDESISKARVQDTQLFGYRILECFRRISRLTEPVRRSHLRYLALSPIIPKVLPPLVCLDMAAACTKLIRAVTQGGVDSEDLDAATEATYTISIRLCIRAVLALFCSNPEVSQLDSRASRFLAAMERVALHFNGTPKRLSALVRTSIQELSDVVAFLKMAAYVGSLIVRTAEASSVRFRSDTLPHLRTYLAAHILLMTSILEDAIEDLVAQTGHPEDGSRLSPDSDAIWNRGATDQFVDCLLESRIAHQWYSTATDVASEHETSGCVSRVTVDEPRDIAGLEVFTQTADASVEDVNTAHLWLYRNMDILSTLMTRSDELEANWTGFRAHSTPNFELALQELVDLTLHATSDPSWFCSPALRAELEVPGYLQLYPTLDAALPHNWNRSASPTELTTISGFYHNYCRYLSRLQSVLAGASKYDPIAHQIVLPASLWRHVAAHETLRPLLAFSDKPPYHVSTSNPSIFWENKALTDVRFLAENATKGTISFNLRLLPEPDRTFNGSGLVSYDPAIEDTTHDEGGGAVELQLLSKSTESDSNRFRTANVSDLALATEAERRGSISGLSKRADMSEKREKPSAYSVASAVRFVRKLRATRKEANVPLSAPADSVDLDEASSERPPSDQAASLNVPRIPPVPQAPPTLPVPRAVSARPFSLLQVQSQVQVRPRVRTQVQAQIEPQTQAQQPQSVHTRGSATSVPPPPPPPPPPEVHARTPPPLFEAAPLVMPVPRSYQEATTQSAVTEVPASSPREATVTTPEPEPVQSIALHTAQPDLDAVPEQRGVFLSFFQFAQDEMVQGDDVPSDYSADDGYDMPAVANDVHITTETVYEEEKETTTYDLDVQDELEEAQDRSRTAGQVDEVEIEVLTPDTVNVSETFPTYVWLFQEQDREEVNRRIAETVARSRRGSEKGYIERGARVRIRMTQLDPCFEIVAQPRAHELVGRLQNDSQLRAQYLAMLSEAHPDSGEVLKVAKALCGDPTYVDATWTGEILNAIFSLRVRAETEGGRLTTSGLKPCAITISVLIPNADVWSQDFSDESVRYGDDDNVEIAIATIHFAVEVQVDTKTSELLHLVGKENDETNSGRDVLPTRPTPLLTGRRLGRAPQVNVAFVRKLLCTHCEAGDAYVEKLANILRRVASITLQSTRLLGYAPDSVPMSVWDDVDGLQVIWNDCISQEEESHVLEYFEQARACAWMQVERRAVTTESHDPLYSFIHVTEAGYLVNTANYQQVTLRPMPQVLREFKLKQLASRLNPSSIHVSGVSTSPSSEVQWTVPYLSPSALKQIASLSSGGHFSMTALCYADKDELIRIGVPEHLLSNVGGSGSTLDQLESLEVTPSRACVALYDNMRVRYELPSLKLLAEASHDQPVLCAGENQQNVQTSSDDEKDLVIYSIPNYDSPEALSNQQTYYQKGAKQSSGAGATSDGPSRQNSSSSEKSMLEYAQSTPPGSVFVFVKRVPIRGSDADVSGSTIIKGKKASAALSVVTEMFVQRWLCSSPFVVPLLAFTIEHEKVDQDDGTAETITYASLILRPMINGTLNDYLQSLACTMKHEPARLWQTKIRCALDCARAVAFLHAKSLAHRDLAGRNFLVDERGRVRLNDFGLTHVVTFGRLSIEASDFALLWSPPEVTVSLGGPRADIWALGVTFLEIAYDGKYIPYSLNPDTAGLSLASLREGLVKGVFSPCNEPLPANTPQVFGDLIRRCCTRRPSERPTAIDVCRELEGLLNTYS